MGIFDTYGIDWFGPNSPTYASPPPGWLGPALSPLPSASPGFGGPAPSPASSPPAIAAAVPPQADATGRGAGGGDSNPFTALFGGIGNFFAPSSPGAAGSPSLGDRAGAALMNFANAHGPVPALAGAIMGATTGQRTDPVGIAQAQQAATTQALVGAGIPPALAQAAALDPNVMRMIAPALYQRSAANAGVAAPAASATSRKPTG